MDSLYQSPMGSAEALQQFGLINRTALIVAIVSMMVQGCTHDVQMSNHEIQSTFWVRVPSAYITNCLGEYFEAHEGDYPKQLPRTSSVLLPQDIWISQNEWRMEFPKKTHHGSEIRIVSQPSKYFPDARDKLLKLKNVLLQCETRMGTMPVPAALQIRKQASDAAEKACAEVYGRSPGLGPWTARFSDGVWQARAEVWRESWTVALSARTGQPVRRCHLEQREPPSPEGQ
jgi:hypothetical protein